MVLARLPKEIKNKKFKFLIHFEMQDPWKRKTLSFVEEKTPTPTPFLLKCIKPVQCLRRGCLEHYLLMCRCDSLPSKLFLLFDRSKASGWSASRSNLSIEMVWLKRCEMLIKEVWDAGWRNRVMALWHDVPTWGWDRRDAVFALHLDLIPCYACTAPEGANSLSWHGE